MNFHGESINDVVNLFSLRFMGLGTTPSVPVGVAMTCLSGGTWQDRKISDELPEMEHLSFEVMHQSECHVLLDLSLATSLISENLHFFFCVLCVGSGKTNRVVIKVAGKCE